MGTILKSQIIDKHAFDSTQVGPLAYLVHKMSGQGTFSVKVLDGTMPKMQFEVKCAPAYEQNSVNIDLSDPKSVKNGVLLNSENGYILFYHSKEFVNWKIVITKASAASKPEFDSHKPGSGDLMALNLLKPGKYSLESSAKQAAEIDVLHPEKITQAKRMEASTNKFSAKDFKLKQTKTVIPNQGMVFEFSKEMPSFSLKLVKEQAAKTPFDEKIRSELKSKLLTKTAKPVTIQKKYTWSGKNKSTK